MSSHKHNILFTGEAWDRMWAYVHQVSGEIGGMGYIKRYGNSLVVDTVFLLPQLRSGGHVDFADASDRVRLNAGTPEEVVVDNAQQWALEKAIADDRVEDLKFSWHSHGNIGCSWSSTDEDAIEKYGMSLDWLASVVLNKEQRMMARIDLFDVPLIGHVSEKDVGISKLSNSELIESVRAEISALTVESVATGSQTTTSQAFDWNSPFSPSYDEVTVAHDGNKITFDEQGLALLWRKDSNEPYPSKFANWLQDQGCIILASSDGDVYAIDTDDSDFAKLSEALAEGVH